MAPAMQSIGHDRYLGFWRTIESVEVRDVQATPGSNDVDVTLVYRTTGGRTSTRAQAQGLSTSDDGDYLIESTPRG